MTTERYILYMEQSSQGDVDFIVSVLNIAGFNFPFYASSGDFGCSSLSLLLKARNKPAAIKKQIEAIPIVNKVALIPISNPLNQSELPDIRTIFLQVGLDTSDVSDEELAMYIESYLLGKSSYYIDFDHTSHRTQPVKISIKRLEDHPNFKPEWIRETNIDLATLIDKEFTSEDITIEKKVSSITYTEPDPFDLDT